MELLHDVWHDMQHAELHLEDETSSLSASVHREARLSRRLEDELENLNLAESRLVRSHEVQVANLSQKLLRTEMVAATVTHVVQECRNLEDRESQTLRELSHVREILSRTETSSGTSRDSSAVPGAGGTVLGGAKGLWLPGVSGDSPATRGPHPTAPQPPDVTLVATLRQRAAKLEDDLMYKEAVLVFRDSEISRLRSRLTACEKSASDQEAELLRRESSLRRTAQSWDDRAEARVVEPLAITAPTVDDTLARKLARARD